MALSKYGYTGTVSQGQWARIMGLLASDYAVRTAEDWAVTAVPGVRQSVIAHGVGGGFGVGVDSDASVTNTHAAPASGRWDLITMLRDWDDPDNTGFVVTPHETLGVSTTPPATWPAVLGGRVSNATNSAGFGTDHQPIAWVYVNSDNTDLVIVDLRTFTLHERLPVLESLLKVGGRGIAYAADSAALTALITSGVAVAGLRVYYAAADALVRYTGSAFKLAEPKRFADDAARSTWTTTYSGLLEEGSEAFTNTGGYIYRGGAWVHDGEVSGVFTRATDFILSTALQAVPFTSAPVLRGLAWSSTVNPSRITCVIPGNYLVNGNNVQVNSTGNGDIQVSLNGTTTFPLLTAASVAGAAKISLTQTVSMVAGDYIEISARSTGAYQWIAANKINVDMLAAR